MNANAQPNTDLGYLLKAVRIGAEEPLAYLRGRDPAAVAGMHGWAAKAHELGVSIAVIEQALQEADAMEAFGPKALPSDGHLTENERKQLIYQHSRRAWNAREDAADPRILLAEERALDACMARLRPILRALAEGAIRTDDGVWVWTPPAGGAEGALDPFVALARIRTTLEGPDIPEGEG
jgi:hypothetical protein